MADLESTTYTATVNYGRHPKDIACTCGGGCGWTGPAVSLNPIEDCSVTPGHPSPAGRCPRCQALAYADECDAFGLVLEERLVRKLRSVSQRLNDPRPLSWDDRRDLANLVDLIITSAIPINA